MVVAILLSLTEELNVQFKNAYLLPEFFSAVELPGHIHLHHFSRKRDFFSEQRKRHISASTPPSAAGLVTNLNGHLRSCPTVVREKGWLIAYKEEKCSVQLQA